MKRKTSATTLAISTVDNDRIAKLCKQQSVSKKGFITIVLDYLERTGINPKNESLPTTELAQLKKRIDFLIRFSKTQEREYTKPALEAIAATENRMQQTIHQLVKKEDLNDFSSTKKDLEIAKLTIRILKEFLLENEELVAFRQGVLERLEKIENKRGLNW